MNELERKVLLAHYIDGLAPSEIVKRHRCDADRVREIIAESWAEDKRCERFERPAWMLVLGLWFNRDAMRWEQDDEAV